MKDIFERIAEKRRRLSDMRPLPKAVLSRLRDEFAVESTYNSTAIEGNTISLRETRLVIEHGMTVKGKSLREHFEINDHYRAVEFVESLAASKTPLTEREILDVHRIVVENVEKEFAGRFRTGQVRIVGANFVPPNHLKLGSLLAEMLANVNTADGETDDVMIAARFHHRFVWIHPFFDGNGRTARLLTDLILMRRGLPPATILYNDRARYYRALNQANSGDLAPFTLLIAQSVERSLDLYLEAVGIFGEDEYRPLSELTSMCSYSQEYLSLLARTGKIDAHKKGRNWLATERSVREYLDGLSNVRLSKPDR